jgi:hypothetical protein
MRGEKCVYPGTRTPLIDDLLHRSRWDLQMRDSPLTPREEEVVLSKLGMRGCVDLTRYAIRRGMVEP